MKEIEHEYGKRELETPLECPDNNKHSLMDGRCSLFLRLIVQSQSERGGSVVL